MQEGLQAFFFTTDVWRTLKLEKLFSNFILISSILFKFWRDEYVIMIRQWIIYVLSSFEGDNNKSSSSSVHLWRVVPDSFLCSEYRMIIWNLLLLFLLLIIWFPVSLFYNLVWKLYLCRNITIDPKVFWILITGLCSSVHFS